MFTDIILKVVRSSLPLRQTNRFRRIQQRKPLTYYEDFTKASEAELKKKQTQAKIPTKYFNQTAKNEIVRKQNEKTNLLELQQEAQRVYEQHDPMYQYESPPDEILEEIIDRVDDLATKQRRSQEHEIETLVDGDQRFGPIVQSAKSLRHRYEKNRILLEGKLLIKDAIQSGIKLEYIYLVKNSNLKDYEINLEKLDYEPKIFKVSLKSFQLWSDVDTPQGIMAIAKLPLKGECKYKRNKNLPFTLVLDQIKDPGNMGTIIRTACGLGVEKILAIKGSVDIWDPKVIRSAMGAHFRIPILHTLNYEEIPGYVPLTSTVLFADSLNSNKYDDNIKKIELNRLIKSNYKFNHVSLVIGNETHGINSKLVNSLGTKETRAIVNIPLDNNVESLNASVACSILCFELKSLLENK